jgi:bacterioferritin-associated ferredoxin
VIVCLCEGVSDRAIRSCISEGSHSLKAVVNACDAGNGCGQCHPDIKRMLSERRQRAGANLLRVSALAAISAA